MLSARRLGKRFGGNWVFRGVEVDLAVGDVLCVVGPNGSGKSTLLKVLAGLLDASEGSVEGPDRLGLGYAALDLALYRHLTAREHLALAARLRGLPALARGRSAPNPRPERPARSGDGEGSPARSGTGGVLGGDARPRQPDSEHGSGGRRGLEARDTMEALDEAGLAAAADRLVGQFSSGMRARLKLTLAVQASPPLLMLDEPRVALDEAGRAYLDAILDAQRARGAAVIATNDQEDRRHATHELVLGA